MTASSPPQRRLAEFGGWESALRTRGGAARRRLTEEALVPRPCAFVLGLEFAAALPKLVSQLPQAGLYLFFRSTLVHRACLLSLRTIPSQAGVTGIKHD